MRITKREFLKTGAAIAAGTLFPKPMMAESARKNWAGNLTYHAKDLLTPATLDEAKAMVNRTPRLRALGTRHCFNGIADTDAAQISLVNLKQMTLDETAKTVNVGAGIRYGDVATWLDARGYALHNLASLPHISVVGGCTTATHGSGLHNGNLSTAVTGIEFLNADGELVTLTRDKNPAEFAGAVVGLGMLGVVTSITLRVQPTYQVRQTVYQNLQFDQLKDNLKTIMGAAYSVSLFTTWQNHRATQVWIKRRIDGTEPHDVAEQFYGATRQTHKLHPLDGVDPVNCTDQMGSVGKWYERLPHFKMEFTPSAGAEIQSEFFVPIEHGYEAILAVEKLKDHITPLLFVTELRTIAADDLWMSMCYQREALAIHFTWKPQQAAVEKVLPMIEQALAPFQPRPHWGKVFTMEPKVLQANLPNLDRFKKLAQQYDPKGKFRNQFVDHALSL